MVFLGEIPQNSCNAALVVHALNKLKKITKIKTVGLDPQLPFMYCKGVVVGVRVQRTADLEDTASANFPSSSTRLGDTPARFVCQPQLTSIQKVLKSFSDITLADHNEIRFISSSYCAGANKSWALRN